MSATKWIVAASVGAVEALKDQGFCRWNYAFRSIRHNARNSVIGTLSQAKNKPAIARSANRSQESEESLRTIMFLSSWAPN